MLELLAVLTGLPSSGCGLRKQYTCTSVWLGDTCCAHLKVITWARFVVRMANTHRHTYLVHTNILTYYTLTHLFGTHRHTYLIHTDTFIYYTQTHLPNTHTDTHTYLVHTDTLTHTQHKYPLGRWITAAVMS